MLTLLSSAHVTSPDDIIEAVGFKSGSSTPQRSGSTAGLHRPRLSIDSASPAIDLPQLSSSLPGSLSGSSPQLTPRQGSHTMDFFEMCASLITTLARWGLLTPDARCNLDVSGVFKPTADAGRWECRCLSDFLFLSPLFTCVPVVFHRKGEWKCEKRCLSPQIKETQRGSLLQKGRFNSFFFLILTQSLGQGLGVWTSSLWEVILGLQSVKASKGQVHCHASQKYLQSITNCWNVIAHHNTWWRHILLRFPQTLIVRSLCLLSYIFVKAWSLNWR